MGIASLHPSYALKMYQVIPERDGDRVATYAFHPSRFAHVTKRQGNRALRRPTMSTEAWVPAIDVALQPVHQNRP
jgi:hypothetical protein